MKRKVPRRDGHRNDYQRPPVEAVRDKYEAVDCLIDAKDPVLEELWDNEKDAEYDRL